MLSWGEVKISSQNARKGTTYYFEIHFEALETEVRILILTTERLWYIILTALCCRKLSVRIIRDSPTICLAGKIAVVTFYLALT